MPAFLRGGNRAGTVLLLATGGFSVFSILDERHFRNPFLQYFRAIDIDPVNVRTSATSNSTQAAAIPKTTTTAASNTSKNNNANISQEGTTALIQKVGNGNNIVNRTSGDNHDGSFSACLMIKDDNFRLPEWLAYHYYVLPLRYLVVLVDPHSKTSPSDILDRWRGRIEIDVWTTDAEFTDENLMITKGDNPKERTRKHRRRQGLFYQECIRHLQKRGRSWTAFHDVDEYITVNGDLVKGGTDMVREPGYVLRLVKTYSETPNENRTKEIPNKWYDRYQSKPCVTLPRALISAVESTPEEIALPDDVPSSVVDPMRLDTLRWRYRHSSRGKSDNLAKSIIDVSRVEPEHFSGTFSAHKPLKSACPSAWVLYKNLPITIFHFLGSWEEYSYREDAREGLHHSYDKWKKFADEKEGGSDDLLRPWISGFVKLVGIQQAAQLLEGSGLPPGYKSNSTQR